MIERKIDLWEIYDSDPASVCCVTTNNFVKSNGEAVMGRGTAKQAADRFPGLAKRLGKQMRYKARNRVQFIGPRLLSFPVKGKGGWNHGDNVVAHVAERFPSGTWVPGWALKAHLGIIACSLKQLERMHGLSGWDKVYLPRPGCGAGELDWETQVKPLCEKYGDWLVVVHL